MNYETGVQRLVMFMTAFQDVLMEFNSAKDEAAKGDAHARLFGMMLAAAVRAMPLSPSDQTKLMITVSEQLMDKRNLQ